MKILFVSEYYPPKIMGGGEINIALTAEALAKEGAEVSVLTAKFSDLAEEEIKNGVKIYRRVKTGKTPRSLWNNFQRQFFFPSSLVKGIKKIVKEISPDVIHFQGNTVIAAPYIKNIKNFLPPLFATVESYPALCPKGDRLYQGNKECTIVCSPTSFLHCQIKSSEIGKMRNLWYLKYNPLFLFLVYRQYQKLNAALKYCTLIPISGYVKQLLELHQLKSVESVPNIIPQQKITLKGEAKGEGKKKILYLGILSKAKGPQILLEALQGLPADSYHCDFYGDGPLKEYLQKKITENNLPAKIHAPVASEQVPFLYQQADLVVVPSLWPEPFGRIPLEAIAMGKKVIASAVGGITETAHEGMCKEKICLVEAGNAAELHKALKEFIAESKNKEKKAYLKQKVKQKVIFSRRLPSQEGFFPEDCFSSPSIAGKLLDIYKNAKIQKN